MQNNYQHNVLPNINPTWA